MNDFIFVSRKSIYSDLQNSDFESHTLIQNVWKVLYVIVVKRIGPSFLILKKMDYKGNCKFGLEEIDNNLELDVCNWKRTFQNQNNQEQRVGSILHYCFLNVPKYDQLVR